ncbi:MULTISPECIES: allantoate amidohydrolase [unclassified Nocardioides]|uniref:allantoate amidohydrolase n=1 Tax=unclassified Nocardioides TaxID=2615069 RepID=UPI0009F073ED|nr:MULTISPECIES: allantoate amidohydrolase [unclassified Nocardioides]GAW49603.1 Putative amidohydrolase [Nocardioides sp. PD653-B2]GAW57557.1 putative amidohydrolase [Nocardioides sp. PD653]
MSFQGLWSDLEHLGRSPRTGGYNRFTGGPTDLTLREWFEGEAEQRGMHVEVDRVGNQWAWLGDPDRAAAQGRKAVVLGSHLDSVPEGGAFDGALGVISAFAAVDQVLADDALSDVPLGIVNFIEEEGGRFGLTCLGSRLLVGNLEPEAALGLLDSDGVSLSECLAGLDVSAEHLGPDREALNRIGTYLELHIEQGRGLVELDRPVAVGSAIRPYGRWRVEFTGEGNHAGTTRMSDRTDPMLGLAELIQVTRRAGERHGCVATIGKIRVTPNAANAIPSQAIGWLDARGPDEAWIRQVAAEVEAIPAAAVFEESFTPWETFDQSTVALLASELDDAPILESGAGHDAGTLASVGIASAMLFVRNPTGVSHSPSEHAEFDDCVVGVDALATSVKTLLL